MRFVVLLSCFAAALSACGRAANLAVPDGDEVATDVGQPMQSDAGADAAAREDATTVTDASVGTPQPYRAIALAVGRDHVCVILDDRKVKCWGFGYEGELGYGASETRGSTEAEMGDALPTVDLGTGRTAVALSANRYSTCALLDDGSVKCWGGAGMNGYAVAHGVAPNQMGDNLPPLPLPAARKVTGVCAGMSWPMATLDDGTSVAWVDGGPTTSALGTPSPVRQISTAMYSMVILYADGTTANAYVDSVDKPTMPFGEPAVEIGGSTTDWCAVLASGRVACSGATSDPFNELPTSGALAIDVGIGHDCALLHDGSVRCWGSLLAGCEAAPGLSYWCAEPPSPSGSVAVRLGQPAVAIGSSGEEFACALLSDGSVKCWGGEVVCAPNADGVTTCQTPPVLGGSVETQVENGVRASAGWYAIDLGTRP